MNERHAVLDDVGWRQTVIRRLSDAVHNMHRAGFIHNDLKWRNILVELGESPAIFLIDCPQGKFLRGSSSWLKWLFRRGRIKDLACLDKVARNTLSRTERLRFYLAATGRSRLDDSARREVREILHFFAGRP